MPMESLKNASPIAVSTTEAVILPKSGLNKNASPSAALSSDKLKAHSSSKSKNKIGISFLVMASMPFVTPISKMEPMNASTPHCHNTDCSGSLMSAAKAASVTWRSLLNMEPRSALTT